MSDSKKDYDALEELSNEQYRTLDFSSLKPSPLTLRTSSGVVQSSTTSVTKSENKQPELNDEDALEAILLKKKPPLTPSLFGTNLERYRYICKDLPSDDRFIDYSFYFTIAACLARKVWIGGQGQFRLFPNQFAIFVGGPGMGKSLAAKVSGTFLKSLVETRKVKVNGVEKLEEAPMLNLGPDTITFEKLVLRAAASSNSNLVSDETIAKGYPKYYSHSSTTFCLADELGMLFTENTKRVVSFLNTAWDCDKFEGDTIKHGVIMIKNICVNLLGCAAPEVMKDLTRTRVFDTGFMGRCLFLYTPAKRKYSPRIVESDEQRNEGEHFKKYLRDLCKMKACEVSFTNEANKWLDKHSPTFDVERRNEHGKLLDYYSRKNAHVQKLAMAIHFAENMNPVIGVRDLEMARNLLERIEIDMHKALCLSGENPQATVMEGIKSFLQIHGATTRQKLKLEFIGELDIEEIDKVLMFMTQSEMIGQTNVNGKPAYKIK